MSKQRIIIDFNYPPIPDRKFDWCAYYDGEEERGEYGYGLTAEGALRDLLLEYGKPASTRESDNA